MAHEFHVDKESGRLDMRTSDSICVDEADLIVEEAKRLCRKHSIRSVLLELGHVHTDTDDLALYKIGRGWAQFARGRVRTAFVKGHFPELDRFVGEVVREHGVAWALFDTRVEAELWLGRKMTPAGPLDRV